jgi:hypothetical protein
MWRRVVAFGAHIVRAARLVLTDRRIPRPLKGLLVLGAMPIPGPFDEAILLLAGGLLYTFYRQPMREAWQGSRVGATQNHSIDP